MRAMTQILPALLYLAPLVVLLYAALRNRKRLDPGVALGLVTGLSLLIAAAVGHVALRVVVSTIDPSDRAWFVQVITKGSQILNTVQLGGWVFFVVGFWKLMPWGKAEAAPAAASPTSKGRRSARVSLGFLIAGAVLGIAGWVTIATAPSDFAALGIVLIGLIILGVGALCWLVSIIVGCLAARHRRRVLWWVIPEAVALVAGLVTFLVNA